MASFQTIEVRWFYRAKLPNEMTRWFDTLGNRLEDSDTRSDFYLQSSSPDVGVKLRQGNLELKYRQQELGRFRIAGVAEDSSIERWSKWVCVDNGAGLTPTAIAAKSGWLQVDKIRDRRLYRVEFGERLKLTQIAIPTANAASIELTRLQVLGQNWWTIACEYFGDDLDLQWQFLPLVDALCAESPLVTVRAQASCGYPQWLIEIQSNASVS